MGLYFLLMSEVTPIKSHKHDCPAYELNRDNNQRYENVEGESRQLGDAEGGEIVFPRKEYTNWLYNNKCSAMKT